MKNVKYYCLNFNLGLEKPAKVKLPETERPKVTAADGEMSPAMGGLFKGSGASLSCPSKTSHRRHFLPGLTEQERMCPREQPSLWGEPGQTQKL